MMDTPWPITEGWINRLMKERDEARSKLAEQEEFTASWRFHCQEARTEVERLREALERIANVDNWLPTEPNVPLEIAREALKPS